VASELIISPTDIDVNALNETRVVNGKLLTLTAKYQKYLIKMYTKLKDLVFKIINLITKSTSNKNL
jgi:predicted ester cyclase